MKLRYDRFGLCMGWSYVVVSFGFMIWGFVDRDWKAIVVGATLTSVSVLRIMDCYKS